MIARGWIVTVLPRHAIAALLVLLAAAQTAPAAAVPSAPAVRTITDDRGQELTVRAPPLRIVSLAPGATEMLFAAEIGRASCRERV
jgi:ABC-type Fe3+-hydroxamate transport system substrate-binding protein